MSQWNTNDDANGSPIWGPALVNKAPNTANRDDLYGNTTANAFIDGVTVGVYGVDASEVAYKRFYVTTVGVANSGVGAVITANAATQLTLVGGNAAVNAVVNVESVQVSTVAVNAAGEGYTSGDTVSVDGGDGTDAVLVVTANATGNVTSLEVVSGGDYANDVPAAVSNTTAVTGNGTGLVVDLELGVKSLSIANTGTFVEVPSNPVGVDEANDIFLSVSFSETEAGIKGGHTGWVLRTEGQGGRAGRVTYEVLVAGGISSDGSDDTILPE